MLISSDRQVRHQLLDSLAHVGLAARTLTTVRSGAAATAAVDRLRPRLVVLDDGLRDLDAQAFITRVHQYGSEMLVVYLATHHTSELERAVRQGGVLYYTQKPLDGNVLDRILSTVFGSLHSPEPSPLRS